VTASRYVTIEDGGERMTHASGRRGVGIYASLCGLDGADIGQRTVPTPRGAKIDCPSCLSLWSAWRDYRASDFAGGGS